MLIVFEFFHFILLPVLILGAVTLSLAAAATSAMIEVTVFETILSSGSNEGASSLVAWTVILGFEAFKMVSAYLIALPEHALNGFLKKRQLFFIRVFLSSISLFATLAYVATSLYASEATMTRTAELQQELDALNAQIQQVQAQTYDPDTDARLDSSRLLFESALETAQLHQDEWRAAEYQEQAEEAQLALDEKIQQYQTEFDADKDAALQDLNGRAADLKTQMDLTNQHTLRDNNNHLIDVVLSMVWAILFQRNYPQICYWGVCFILSLVLGLGLELIITAGLKIISLPQSQVRVLFNETAESSKVYSFVLRITLQSFCAFSAILLINLFLGYTAQSNCLDLGIAFFSLITGLPLLNLFFDGRSCSSDDSKGTKDSPLKTLLRGSQNVGLTSAVLIVIYCLLGLLTRSIDPSDMSIPQAAALMVGAVGSTAFEKFRTV